MASLPPVQVFPASQFEAKFAVESSFNAGFSSTDVLGVFGLGIWNGTQYQQWVNYMVEARWGSYWFDKAAGILWIIGWYWYMGYEVAITYKYGYNTAGTLNLDGRIRLLALYKATKLFLDNERYTAQVSEGIGGISMQDLWKYLVQDIAEIEHWIQSFRVMTGSWMP